MKTVFITYNNLTLCKAIIYCKDICGLQDSLIFHTPTVTKMPYSIPPELNCIGINIKEFDAYKERKKKSKLFFKVTNPLMSIIMYKRMGKRIFQQIRKRIIDRNELINLVIFKDNDIREAIVIKEVKKRYKTNKVILIEEGLELYNSLKPIKRDYAYWVKRAKFFVCNIPSEILNYSTDGYNKCLEKIICRRPELIDICDRAPNIIIEKEIDVFSEENCKYLLNNVYHVFPNLKHFDFVFLTQPSFPTDDEIENQKYDAFLKRIIETVTEYGSLFFKVHPRDRWDYSCYSGITLCSTELNSIPFECLYGYLGRPRPLTLFSTAACSVNPILPALFLYELLPSKSYNVNGLDDAFFEKEGVISCKTFDMFRNELMLGRK